MTDKVQATHLQRRAVVYVRQSTVRQVIEHPESSRRQRDLYQRALQLGWPENAIEVIERDLGKSANIGGSPRTGFQHLSEEVIQGRVGAVFALEVARLARSSTEWHRLLDLCGVADVVIVDEQAAYHPADPSDRMFLGIKGAMSEAELGWMRQRMRGALVSKARRGEHRMSDPAGYHWDNASARFTLDADEEVQRALKLVFERFRIERNAGRVLRYFQQHHLRLPVCGGYGGATVRWSEQIPRESSRSFTTPSMRARTCMAGVPDTSNSSMGRWCVAPGGCLLGSGTSSFDDSIRRTSPGRSSWRISAFS